MAHTSISRRTLATLVGLAGLSGLGAADVALAPAARAAQTWDPRDPAWALIPELSEDFDTPASEDRWVKGLWYPGAGTVQRFADSSVIFDVEAGVLRLRATAAQPGEPARYRFGAVESRADIPGVASYTEVRAKMLDSRANVLSAIWQQSSRYDHVDHLLGGANPHPEIDIHEFFANRAMDSATHTWRDGSSAGHVAYGGHTAPAGADLSEDFHLYGVERRAGTLRFYLDRQCVFEAAASNPQEQGTTPERVHTSLARMSRHQVLSLEAHRGEPVPEFLPADFVIDYVHVHYHVGGALQTPGEYLLRHRATGRFLAASADGAVRLDVPGHAAVIRVSAAGDGTFTLTTRAGLHLTIADGDYRLRPPVLAAAAVDTGIGHEGSKSRWHVRRAADDEAFIVQSKFSGLALAPDADGQIRQVEPTLTDGTEFELVEVRGRARGRGRA